MTTAGSTANLIAEDEGRALLKLARETLEKRLKEGRPDASPPSFSGKLAEPRGVFVTLTREGKLRGCTGYVEPVKPLAAAVADLAISSALRDHRFEPVQADEVDRLHIEISVLTPPYPIKPEDVVIGRHGLIARYGGRSGLLLPQVAIDWGFAREEFIRRTCEKAGLAPDTWQRGGFELKAFEAQIFEESAEPSH